ncbi:MAG TPA: hypothetical protein PLR83_12110, partial [Pyrinomonadaceae bacterium]|nr:hypothetical protein [Pyrinomonadaceae bacterium]
RIETVLQDYETTKDPEPVRAYLFARREAEGMTARIQFVTWGREHQEGFLAITDTFDRAQTGRECDLLAFVMTDSGQDDDFEAAFRNYESKCLEIIRSKIAGYRSIQK